MELQARVAELVDALDLGSSGIAPWEFESPLSHHIAGCLPAKLVQPLSINWPLKPAITWRQVHALSNLMPFSIFWQYLR